MKRILIIYIFLSFIFTLSAQVKKNLTLENALDRKFFALRTITGLKPLNDGQQYTISEGDTKITRYSYKTVLKTGEVFNLEKIPNSVVKSFNDYEFSQDETRILFTTDVKPLFRRTFTAKYYVWNSITEEFTPLSEKGAQQTAVFSPDGEKIAFIRGNNIFIKNLKFGTESQVTYNGEKNKIINGSPDWVYEEEFNVTRAFDWSPDNKFLAYIRFNETDVPEFRMNMFRGDAPELKENAVYPSVQSIKYPKAGEKNSEVSVHVYDLKSKTTLSVDLGKEKDIYVPKILFTPDGANLAIMRMNRRQDKLDVLYANPNTGDSRIFYTETNKKFIDENFLDGFTFLPDGRFIVLSERTGWFQLFLYDKQGFEAGRIAPGDYDVTKFYGFDPVRKIFYYQAAAESPLRREVYFFSADGKKKGKLSTMEGTNDAQFSKGFNYYVNTYSTKKSPSLYSIHDFSSKQIKVLESNEALKNKLNEYDLPTSGFFTFTTSEGILLNGWIMKPSFFDSSKKYPVVLSQYSGPNSQSVADSWGGIRWNEYLAQQGFVVVCVDPRGTAARGEEFRKATYMQLGKPESDDMVEAARYISTLPFVDSGNISIWGWSYGGFMVCNCLEKGGSLFKAGIAVAPVTSWRFYDSIYTERYMRSPSENPDGYEESSPLKNAGTIKSRFLIIHGTADDNVHAQNTYEFTEKMVQAGVQFDMAIYTNRNHNITGGNTTMHLYMKMTDFLKKNLQ
jgi:dipeptidyl-peptidase 4